MTAAGALAAPTTDIADSLAAASSSTAAYTATDLNGRHGGVVDDAVRRWEAEEASGARRG